MNTVEDDVLKERVAHQKLEHLKITDTEDAVKVAITLWRAP